MKDYQAAADYLIMDGFYGPFSPLEWANCNDQEIDFRTRSEAITLVNEYADQLADNDIRLIREVYGRFPI